MVWKYVSPHFNKTSHRHGGKRVIVVVIVIVTVSVVLREFLVSARPQYLSTIGRTYGHNLKQTAVRKHELTTFLSSTSTTATHGTHRRLLTCAKISRTTTARHSTQQTAIRTNALTTVPSRRSTTAHHCTQHTATPKLLCCNEEIDENPTPNFRNQPK